MNVTTVSTLELPALHPYRTLRRPMDHQKQGIFVAEGDKVVKRLLESEIRTVSVLLTPEWFEAFLPLLESKKIQPDIYLAQKKLVETIVGFHLHQGVMAVGQIPEPALLENVLEKSPRPRLLVAADGLTNAENLGVLVRNCAAFGVQAILVGETSSSPYLRRAVRNSMGTVFQIPVVHLVDLRQSLLELWSRHRIKPVAAHPQAEKVLADTSALAGDCCIVFGSEGGGISPHVLAACDESVAIPMIEGVDSLNVASASAVVLYEASRQRGGNRP